MVLIDFGIVFRYFQVNDLRFCVIRPQQELVQVILELKDMLSVLRVESIVA